MKKKYLRTENQKYWHAFLEKLFQGKKRYEGRMKSCLLSGMVMRMTKEVFMMEREIEGIATLYGVPST